jgi:hypothetical protein
MCCSAVPRDRAAVPNCWPRSTSTVTPGATCRESASCKGAESGQPPGHRACATRRATSSIHQYPGRAGVRTRPSRTTRVADSSWTTNLAPAARRLPLFRPPRADMPGAWLKRLPGTAARVAVAGLAKRVAVAWRRARRRYGWLDHLVRAAVRYDQADGGRLAAAVTYYAFFATFAMVLLGVAVFGFVLDDPAVLRAVQRYLTENLPRLDVHALRHARDTVGVIAVIGLPITGWLWIDSLRSSIRAIWRLPEYPGTLLVRVLVDLLVLLGLGMLLAASLAVAFAITAAAGRAGHRRGHRCHRSPVAARGGRVRAGRRREHAAVDRRAHRTAAPADAAAPSPGARPARRRRPGSAQDPRPPLRAARRSQRHLPRRRRRPSSSPAPSGCWSSSTSSTNSCCSRQR